MRHPTDIYTQYATARDRVKRIVKGVSKFIPKDDDEVIKVRSLIFLYHAAAEKYLE